METVSRGCSNTPCRQEVVGVEGASITRYCCTGDRCNGEKIDSGAHRQSLSLITVSVSCIIFKFITLILN